MTGITLSRPEVFPPGTDVDAYPASNWLTLPPSGAPVGSAADEATVDESGNVAFSGLDSDADYYAVAQVGAVYRYISFRTSEPGTSGAGPWNEVGGEDAPFANGWGHLEEEDFAPLRYYANGGRICLEGFITGGSGAFGQVICTLPEGARPDATTVIFAGYKTRELVRIYVDAAGEVKMGEATPEPPAFLAINGTFRAA